MNNLELTFLHACENNEIVTFENLLGQILNINFTDNMRNTPIMRATLNGARYIVNSLIVKGADVNHQNNDGNTALIISALTRRRNIIELLTDNAADVSIKNNDRQTAYDIAVALKMTMPTNFLIKNRPVDEQDDIGNTLLIKACHLKIEDDIFLLYENGADFYLKNNAGDNAINMLNRKRKLSAELTALMEKIMLDELMDKEESTIFSL